MADQQDQTPTFFTSRWLDGTRSGTHRLVAKVDFGGRTWTVVQSIYDGMHRRVEVLHEVDAKYLKPFPAMTETAWGELVEQAARDFEDYCPF